MTSKTAMLHDDLEGQTALELPERTQFALDTNVVVVIACNTCNVSVQACQFTVSSCNVWQFAYL